MLHITFNKLPACSQQKLFARYLWRRRHHCHYILQLISEAEGTTSLVESRTGPEPANDGLVEIPAIYDKIKAAIWCFNLNCAEQILPECMYAFKCANEIHSAQAAYQISAAERSEACPRIKTISTFAPALSSISACRAVQGSSPPPKRLRRGSFF